MTPAAEAHLTIYGITRAVGALLGIWLLPAALGRSRGIEPRVWEQSFLPVIGASFIGSIAAGHFLTNGWHRGWAKLSSGDIYWRGGEGIAGFILAYFAFWVCWRLKGFHSAKICDAEDTLAAPVILMVAIFKVGCHFAGCCEGVLYDGPFAVWFPAGTSACQNQIAAGLLLPGAARTLPVFPAQLAEALAMALFGGLLLFWYRRKQFRGLLGEIFVIGYCGWRFFSEWFRADHGRGELGPISLTQLLAIGTIVVVAATLVVTSYRRIEFEV